MKYPLLLSVMAVLASPFMVIRPLAFLIIERTCNFAHQVPLFDFCRYFLNFICKVQWNTFPFLSNCPKMCAIVKYVMWCSTHRRNVWPVFRVWSCSPLPFSTIACSFYSHLPQYLEGVWQPLSRQQKPLLAREFYFEFTNLHSMWDFGTVFSLKSKYHHIGGNKNKSASLLNV